MTNLLPDSFDLSETVDLLKELSGGEETVGGINSSSVFKSELTEVNYSTNFIKHDDFNANRELSENIEDPDVFKDYSSENKTVEKNIDFEIDGDDPLYKLLAVMCKRGSFEGAVIADEDGLPLAVYNSPAEDQVLAAYASILGESLEKAESFLHQSEANNISMDINNLDKIVLRRFKLREVNFYLLIIAPQNIDERAEVELAISEIKRSLD